MIANDSRSTKPGFSQALWLAAALALVLTSCVTPTETNAIRTDINNLKQESYQGKRSLKSLEDKLADMQKNIEVLSSRTDQVPKEESLSALRSSQTSLFSQLSDLIKEVQTLRGRFEENKYFLDKQVKQITSEIDVIKAKTEGPDSSVGSSQIRDIAVRLSNVEAELVLLKSKLNALSAGKVESSKDAPKELYDKAYGLFNEKKYSDARKLWKDFLKDYPTHQLAGNSQFWIGDTFFAEDDYDDAILAYEEVLVSYKDSPKVPAAMLKQAYAFLKLGDKKAARGILRNLIDKHPKSDVIESARATLKTIE